jgi:hypothetical protein
MVGSSHINIHTLTLDELVGVVNLYPWYGAARVELCRRMSAMGPEGSDEREFAAEALFVQDRSKLAALVRRARQVDCSDKDVRELLAAYLQPQAPSSPEEAPAGVRVVGGDYFSQAQYDQVKDNSDNIFTRFAARARSEGDSPEEGVSDIADRFATETLARIFAEQGRNEEARRIYSRLVLDIPEKSAYFASLIDELD